jgi:hypothetical protein
MARAPSPSRRGDRSNARQSDLATELRVRVFRTKFAHVFGNLHAASVRSRSRALLTHQLASRVGSARRVFEESDDFVDCSHLSGDDVERLDACPAHRFAKTRARITDHDGLEPAIGRLSRRRCDAHVTRYSPPYDALDLLVIKALPETRRNQGDS